jgi:hypothetical protein
LSHIDYKDFPHSIPRLPFNNINAMIFRKLKLESLRLPLTLVYLSTRQLMKKLLQVKIVSRNAQLIHKEELNCERKSFSSQLLREAFEAFNPFHSIALLLEQTTKTTKLYLNMKSGRNFQFYLL